MITYINCKDEVGLIARIAKEFSKRNLNIINFREHCEIKENKYFTRIVSEDFSNPGELKIELLKILPDVFDLRVELSTKKNIVILVTKEYHCLADILVKNHFDKLGANVVAVIGNHITLKDICTKFDVPFFHISHENKTKELFELELNLILKKFDFDYIILAKFMRILSPEFICDKKYKIINIHHSFLPAFVGSSPYKQAFDRGVKLIGATAHFVTENLDEGPIIAQSCEAVSHALSVSTMTTIGAEVEKKVLIKAMKLVFEESVFVYGNKTIVFE